MAPTSSWLGGAGALLRRAAAGAVSFVRRTETHMLNLTQSIVVCVYEYMCNPTVRLLITRFLSYLIFKQKNNMVRSSAGARMTNN